MVYPRVNRNECKFGGLQISAMLDIDGKDISLLSDRNLHDLIGRLCEADLRGNSLSPLAVTYGGGQNASKATSDTRMCDKLRSDKNGGLHALCTQMDCSNGLFFGC